MGVWDPMEVWEPADAWRKREPVQRKQRGLLASTGPSSLAVPPSNKCTPVTNLGPCTSALRVVEYRKIHPPGPEKAPEKLHKDTYFQFSKLAKVRSLENCGNCGDTGRGGWGQAPWKGSCQSTNRRLTSVCK